MFILRIPCGFKYNYIQNTDVVTPQGTIKAVADAQIKPNDEVWTKSYFRPNLHNQCHYRECTSVIRVVMSAAELCEIY
jgi:hypothetical protein